MKPLVVVTGGAGLIGRAVRQKLLSLGYGTVSIDINPHEAFSPSEKIVIVDLEDRNRFFQIWKSLSADYALMEAVIHLAAFYDFTNLPNAHYQELHRTFREWLPNLGRDLPRKSRIILASSMAALAPTLPGIKLLESSERAGGWQYPASKILNENTFETAVIPQTKIELVLAGVYTDFCELVPLYRNIERFSHFTLEAFFFPGPTDRGLTYVHLDEVSEAFAKAAVFKKSTTQTERFLIGQSKPLTYSELKRAVQTVFGSTPFVTLRVPQWFAWLGAWLLKILNGSKRRFVQPWMIRFSSEHFEFDLSHARTDLDWVPTHDIHADLPKILTLAKREPALFKARNDARPW